MLLGCIADDLTGATDLGITLAREGLLPPRPPYEERFKGKKATLTAKHYVMDEFWKEEISNWKKRGFEVVKDSGKTIELRGTIADTTGNYARFPKYEYDGDKFVDERHIDEQALGPRGRMERDTGVGKDPPQFMQCGY